MPRIAAWTPSHSPAVQENEESNDAQGVNATAPFLAHLRRNEMAIFAKKKAIAELIETAKILRKGVGLNTFIGYLANKPAAVVVSAVVWVALTIVIVALGARLDGIDEATNAKEHRDSS